MNRRRSGLRLLFYMAAVLCFASVAAPAATAQIELPSNNVRVTGIDLERFPTVGVRVLATTNGSEPVSDLSSLVLREDGVVVPDVSTAAVPVGIDLVLVLDANSDYLLADEWNGLTRREKVAAGIARFAGQYMDPAGLDRVSVIVPDEFGEAARFLATDVTQPSALTAAVAAYEPAPPRVTPLNAMLSASLDHLAAQSGDGRFQAILLYTDGARLDRQLDYQSLVAEAQAAGIPIFAAILGAEASQEEIANVAALYRPTNGQYLHMPQPEAADPFYRLFQALGRQTEIAYRSTLRQAGEHEVSVTLGNDRTTARFDLDLALPEVVLEAPESIRRVGSAPDTPLPLLQPAVQALTARISWPDNRPRALADFRFLVDGVAQTLPAPPAPDAAGEIPLVWDISELEAGRHTLSVELTDELGFRAASAPIEVTVDTTRPPPPTPTVAPTRAPGPVEAAIRDGRAGRLVAPATLLLFALVIVLWAWRRIRRRRARLEPPAPVAVTPAVATRPPDRHVPYLEWRDTTDVVTRRVELPANDVTLGSAEDAVDIVVTDPSVSPLHARIRRTDGDEYWLYDEGSVMGTSLNYERLGLAPRQMQHGDVVQLGRVTLRFVLELPPRSALTSATAEGSEK